jgi:hypothetical protein
MFKYPLIRKVKKQTLLLITLVCAVFTTHAQKLSYEISKTSDLITLDGVGDEAVWQEADIANGFSLTFPVDTGKAENQTEVRMTFDDKALYVYAICHDRTDGEYVIQSLKRDYSYPVSDAFAIFIDPFNDQTNGFSFSVNPMGAQREGTLDGGGGFGVTTAWDGIWYSEVKRNKDSWTLEMKIPFNTIRFPKNFKNWRVNFGRNDLKSNQSSTWAPVPRGFNVATMTMFAPLNFTTAPKSSTNIALIPYASVNRYNSRTQNPDFNKSFGADFKFALTSSLNLDVTVNPDFSQVEVDVQQINLTRFNLFFPERRTFFTENADLFSRNGFSKIRPFFSRKIGLSPSGLIPIKAGVKLSGKIGSKMRIGAIAVQTDEVQSEGVKKQNYGTVSLQRQIFKSSNIAAMIVHKQSADSSDFNTVGGFDFNFQSPNGKWRGKAFYHKSWENEDKEKSYAHATWLKYNDTKLSVMWNHEYVNKDYRADVGFVPRINYFDPLGDSLHKISYWRLEPDVSYVFQRNSEKINNWVLGVYNSTYFDSSYSSFEYFQKHAFAINFQDLKYIQVYHEIGIDNFLFQANLLNNASEFIPDSTYMNHKIGGIFKSNYRKPLSIYTEVKYGSFYVGEALNLKAELAYRRQPWGVFGLRLDYNRFYVDSKYGDNELILIGAKSEFSLSTTMYITNFVQYNTQAENININTRFQWRFRPMSDIFIVHSMNYNSQFVDKNNSLVFKLVYWLNT